MGVTALRQETETGEKAYFGGFRFSILRFYFVKIFYFTFCIFIHFLTLTELHVPRIGQPRRPHAQAPQRP